jgi:cytochrome c oxidase cbb3-type subunit 2
VGLHHYGASCFRNALSSLVFKIDSCFFDMKQIVTLLLGCASAFLLAWVSVVVIPLWQGSKLELALDADSGELLPFALSGLAERGRQVYATDGCVACHTQQIRAKDQGYDTARGWGERRSVPRDYLNLAPAFLGSIRLGPDLSNIGKRQRSAAWHHQHLYAPASHSVGTIMPAFAFLYDVSEIKGAPSAERLILPPPYAPAAGYQVVPKSEAKALVAYLLSLNQSYDLPEAPKDE